MKSLFLISAALVPAALAQSAAWAQCGGIGFTGSTSCVSGYTCSYVNSYYSQCIPGTAAATSTSGASTPVQSALQSLCTQYAYASVNGYDLLNNLWGIAQATSGSQCTYYLGAVGSGISWSTAWTWAGGENDVKSYAYAGRQITRKLISSISSLPTTANWNYNTTNIRANVAYDIFTAADVNHSQSSGDYELMIWLNRYGGVWPITSTGPAIATVTIAGYSWDVYFGYNGAMKVYSFLAVNGPLTSFTADVKLFFNYLASNQGFPASSQYMLIYQFGTEAFTGGPALMTVSQFNAAVN